MIGKLPGLDKVFRRVFRVASERHLNIQRVYQLDENIVNFYREWFDYIEQLDLNIKHNMIVTLNKEFSIYTRAEWERKIQS